MKFFKDFIYNMNHKWHDILHYQATDINNLTQCHTQHRYTVIHLKPHNFKYYTQRINIYKYLWSLFKTVVSENKDKLLMNQ